MASRRRPLLKREQAAELLAVRTSWIYEAVRTNRLPCLRIGRHIRFTRDVRVSIAEASVPSTLVRRLRTGDFDLAVVFDYSDVGENIGLGLELHQLLDVPFDVAVPADHPLARKRRMRAIDLAEEDWLLPDYGPESPSLKLIGRMCSAASFEPRVAFRVSNCQMTLAMDVAGEGITLLPRLMLQAHPADVAIKPLSGEIPQERVSAVRLPSRYLTPATAGFLDVLSEAAKPFVDGRVPRRRR